MTKSYYDLLEVPPSAPAEEIKRAFRREIAKYHPDKVQHLGREFQDIAAVKAAELTQAYKTLSDAVLRAEYDEQLGTGQLEAGPSGPSSVPTSSPTPPPPAAPSTERPSRHQEPDEAPKSGGASSVFSQERAGATELVRRATVMRFRQALIGEFTTFQEIAIGGFDVTCVPKPAFFSLKLPPRVLGRFVDHVDRATLAETWGNASRLKKDNQRDVVVFLMGPMVAPAGELASAITEQRRKPMPAGGKLYMVPVNTRNWHAHIPADAPAVIKSLVSRLKSS
jgi:curved DNA-binding protein CbpA